MTADEIHEKIIELVKGFWVKGLTGKLLAIGIYILLWPIEVVAYSIITYRKYGGKRGYLAVGVYLLISFPLTAGWMGGINQVLVADNRSSKAQQVTTPQPSPVSSPVPVTQDPIPTPQPTVEITNPNRVKTTVARVIDGDTLEVNINGLIEKIRIIGINTPETVDPRKSVECFGMEASNTAKSILSVGREIELEADPTQQDRDQYNRLLRYVWFENGQSDFGEIMISRGFAYEYTYNTPYKYQEKYKQAQKTAESSKAGLWADNACLNTPPPTQKPTIKPTLKPTVPYIPYVQPTQPPAQPTAVPAVNNPPPPAQSNRSCTGPDLDCSDFSTQSEAQAFFDGCGFTANHDPMRLDTSRGVGNGIPCESLP